MNNSKNWKTVNQAVRTLQLRIAKAIKEGKYNKVKALQWMLTHSFAAILLAVKRVTENSGKRTPGVDGVLWKSSTQKLRAALSLIRKSNKAKPLRRHFILKKNGKKRPLGIPTMTDRAYQALYLLALEPVSETLADKGSYGAASNYGKTRLSPASNAVALRLRGPAAMCETGPVIFDRSQKRTLINKKD